MIPVGSFPVISLPKGSDLRRFFQSFKDGEILTAKVLARSGSQGRVRLLINGKSVVAACSMDLSPGQQIRIALIRENSGLRMELLPSREFQIRQASEAGVHKFQGNPALFNTKDYSGTQDVPPVLTRVLSRGMKLHRLFSGKDPAMKKIFSALSLKSDIPDKNFLPKLISLGGFMFEKKMAGVFQEKGAAHLRQIMPQLVQQDAKGQALSLLGQTMDAREILSSAVAGFADAIEFMQIVNSQNSEAGRCFLPFPIADPQGFRLGQLFVDLNSRNNKDRGKCIKNIKIAFLLDMSRIGAVRADFFILDRAITGRFLFEKEDACSKAVSMIPQLREGLAKVGFHAAAMDCVLARPREVGPGIFMETCLQPSSDAEVHIVI